MHLLTLMTCTLNNIVQFIYLFKMHLSTLKTLCHSYSMCKLLYAVFDLSTLKTLYHSYIYGVYCSCRECRKIKHSIQ